MAWQAIPLDTPDIRWGVATDQGEPVAEVFTQSGVLDLIARARVCAASYDLLGACEALMAVIREDSASNELYSWDLDNTPAYQAGLAAIKKAREG